MDARGGATCDRGGDRHRHDGRPGRRRARGRVGGRRPKLTADQAALAQELYDTRDKTVQQIANLFGVPRSTVYGHLKDDTVRHQPEKTLYRA